MARAKKKEKEMTIEEKLERALVPVEEQPYEIPENWCWVYLLKGFAECKDSFRKPINAAERADRLGNVPYYGATGQVGWIDDYLTDEQLVLLGEDGAPFLDLMKDKAYIISGKAWVNNHAHILCSYYGEAGNYYLMHYLNQFNFKGYVNGTTRLKLTQSSMDDIPIPLPPLFEQKRIINRIDSIFVKLEEIREKTQSVVDGVENRKAAILRKAFTGEMTERWRKDKKIGLEHWRLRKLKDCGDWFGGGTPSMSHPEYWENGKLLWVTSKDMKVDLIEDTLMHVNMLGVNNSSACYIEKPSILFVLRSGILRRTLPIAMVKVPFTVNQDLKGLTPDNIDLEYLYYACKNFERNILGTCMKNGTTVESINAKSLLNFEIPIAPVEEQKIIAINVKKLLYKEKKAQNLAETVLEKIDYMKKTILVSAFRGELNTNNSSDESAVELLKKVLEQMGSECVC